MNDAGICRRQSGCRRILVKDVHLYAGPSVIYTAKVTVKIGFYGRFVCYIDRQAGRMISTFDYGHYMTQDRVSKDRNPESKSVESWSSNGCISRLRGSTIASMWLV